MLKVTNKTIKGHEYTITSMPALQNTCLAVKFASYLGCSLPDLFTLFSGANPSAIGEGINKIIKSLYVNDPSLQIVLEIMSQTSREGKPINQASFDVFYTGNIEEMTEALFQTMTVHFTPFLPLEKLGINFGNLIDQGKEIKVSAEN